MSRYVVLAGNVGTVFQNDDYHAAMRTFHEYVVDSKRGVGRVAGESVVLMKDGEPLHQYDAPAQD